MYICLAACKKELVLWEGVVELAWPAFDVVIICLALFQVS